MMQGRPSPRNDMLERIYWEHVARAQLCLQRCTGCDRFRYPPAPTCDDCGSVEAEWRPLSGSGRIVAWTIFHRSYFPALPAPYTIVSVQTKEGPLLVGNLIETGGPPKIGALVQAVFIDAQFDDGTTGRICQWQPVQDDTLSTQGEFR